MRDLVDVKLQGWTHLFECPVPVLYEKEVRNFYYNMQLTGDGSLNTMVNGYLFHLSEEILGEILQVPTKRIRSVTKEFPSPWFIKEIGKVPGLS